MKPKPTFGQRVASLRESRGWTRYRLAQKTGLSKTTIATLESTGANPKLESIAKLAEVFGVTVGELMG